MVTDVKESRKRQLEGEDDGGDAKRYNFGNEPLLKLLVPNYAAGAILGKGGANLSEIKETYGGFIRLSSGKQYYPGTDERLVVITGDHSQIIDISNYVMEKVEDPGRDESMKKVQINADRAKQVKIVLTNGAAGALIGRSGANIKAIQEESKARVSVAMLEKATVQGERVVTVSGNLDQRTEACRQIIEKIASEASNMANTKIKYVSHGTDMPVGHNIGAGYQVGADFNSRTLPAAYQRGADLGSQLYQSSSSMYQSNVRKLPAKFEVSVRVPSVLVGGILGKQGSIIKDFALRSGGAKFKFAEKSEENTDGAAERILTITGSMEQTQLAYSFVNE